MTPQSDTKLCPDCAEEIKAAARVCRFCGYRFADPGLQLAPVEQPGDEQPEPQAVSSVGSDEPHAAEPEGSSPELGLGAVPGSLRSQFAETLDATEGRLHALRRQHDQTPRSLNRAARAAGRACAMQEGAAQANLRKLRKQLARPDKHTPPEWPQGMVLLQLAAMTTSMLNGVVTLVEMFAGKDLGRIDPPTSNRELLRLGLHPSEATANQIQHVEAWLAHASQVLDRQTTEVESFCNRQTSFRFAEQDAPDGSLFALACETLHAFLMRGRKWLMTASSAVERPDAFIAHGTGAQQYRSFELSFLTLDAQLDILEKSIKELYFVARL